MSGGMRLDHLPNAGRAPAPHLTGDVSPGSGDNRSLISGEIGSDMILTPDIVSGRLAECIGQDHAVHVGRGNAEERQNGWRDVH